MLPVAVYICCTEACSDVSSVSFFVNNSFSPRLVFCHAVCSVAVVWQVFTLQSRVLRIDVHTRCFPPLEHQFRPVTSTGMTSLIRCLMRLPRFSGSKRYETTTQAIPFNTDLSISSPQVYCFSQSCMGMFAFSDMPVQCPPVICHVRIVCGGC